MRKTSMLLWTFLFFIVIPVGLTSCDNDDDSKSNSLIGWYTDLSKPAKASDFNEINQAIYDKEILSSYYYGGSRHNYVASRDLFFYDDGMYSDSDAHFGRLRFKINSQVHSIRIIDNSTLVEYYAFLYEDGAYGANGMDAVYRINAGPVFGNMTYYDTGYYYTYIVADNKIIVSNGDLYSITDGGLIKDGSSSRLSKYDPSTRY